MVKLYSLEKILLLLLLLVSPIDETGAFSEIPIPENMPTPVWTGEGLIDKTGSYLVCNPLYNAIQVIEGKNGDWTFTVWRLILVRDGKVHLYAAPTITIRHLDESWKISIIKETVSWVEYRCGQDVIKIRECEKFQPYAETIMNSLKGGSEV